MKKTILSFLCAISATMGMAQTNPRSGYVITNSGDTIRGIIDLRTNERLSKQCEFWANGEATGKTYKPGDIEGFRFDNGGKYFVSRRLNVTGTPELYFAEFMVQGKMNLYCISYSLDDYYFFEREDGEMALLTNRTLNYTSDQSAFENQKAIKQEKREQYGKVKILLQQSGKAVDDMDDQELTKKKLVNVVRDYHNDVCTDGSKCVVYEYDEKNDNGMVHFKAFAGFAYYSKEITDCQIIPQTNYSGSALEIGIGLEFNLERLIKDFSAELTFAFSPNYKSTKDAADPNNNSIVRKWTYKRNILTFSLGGIKRFGNGKIQPLVRGGAFVAMHLGMEETSQLRTYAPVTHDWSDAFSRHFGIFLGAGAQMPVGKHYTRVHADWYNSIGSKQNQMTKWGLTAEFIL